MASSKIHCGYESYKSKIKIKYLYFYYLGRAIFNWFVSDFTIHFLQNMFRQVQLVAIVASTPSAGIGYKNRLPWPYLEEDMRMFHDLTTRTADDDQAVYQSGRFNAIICGRNTWESLPKAKRPLASRLNIVISSKLYETRIQADNQDQLQCDPHNITSSSLYDCEAHRLLPQDQWIRSTIVFCTFNACIKFLQRQTYMDVDRCFVIGGTDMYYSCVDSPLCQQVYWTHVKSEFPCDVSLCGGFLYILKNRFILREQGTEISQNDLRYVFCSYYRMNLQEQNYLDLVDRIMVKGDSRMDRTGVGTTALFGQNLRFDLNLGFPLLTTKRTFFRGIVEELLWMIRGCTDSTQLSKVGVKIWDKNGSREFLDNRGLNENREGDLGPIYGFQWRHYGAKYINCDTDYTGQGVDQLQQMIDTIKTNPTDRRIIMSAWNPEDLKHMALPPCHMFCQMFVDTKKHTLSCMMYQRSCDMGLGVPFNIASYALFTHMIANVCNLRVGELIINMGDAHVYNTHNQALITQLDRTPYPFPTLRIKRQVSSIDDFVAQDFELERYVSHPSIAMDMAV